MFSAQPAYEAGVRAPWGWTTVWAINLEAWRSGSPPLRPGRHCTGTPSASVASGATVAHTGDGPPSRVHHSAVTACARPAPILGPGLNPPEPQMPDPGRARGNLESPAR